MDEGEAYVRGAEAGEGAKLVSVEQASGPAGGRQSDCYYAREDF